MLCEGWMLTAIAVGDVPALVLGKKMEDQVNQVIE